MNCPKCGAPTDANICKNCNTDILEYSIVDKMSCDAYNIGLDFARNNEITKAIVELTNSVQYNSTNITALNLLGICYDRIGRISDASKYWIRSCLVLDENIAQVYLKKVEENSSVRERLNDSIKNYNQAIIYLKQGNDDMAFINIKKAVEYNSNFVDAMNLLALVLIKRGENENAISILKNVIEIDKSNETALSYLDSLNYKISKKASKQSNKQVNKVKKDNNINIQTSKPISPKYTQNTSAINKRTITAFGLGVLLMLIVCVVLIIPNMRNNITDTVISTEKSYKEQIEQQNTLMSAKDTEINNLKSENEKLKTENETLTTNYNVLNVNSILLDAEESISNRDYQTAADQIMSINTADVKAEQIDRYNELKGKAYPEASKAYHQSGIKAYDAQNYDEALSDFQKSIDFGGTDKPYYPNTLFYTGRCYEGLGDIQQAKTYYQKVIDEFPNNDTVYSAKNRLNTIS